MTEEDRIDRLSAVQAYLDLVEFHLQKLEASLINSERDFAETKTMVEYANFRIKRVIRKEKYLDEKSDGIST